MTVNELIGYLADMPQEAQVIISVDQSETGLGIVVLEERPNKVPHVIFS